MLVQENDIGVLEKADLKDWFEELSHEIIDKKINIKHSNDVKVINNIKTDLLLMLYNYRDNILKTLN